MKIVLLFLVLGLITSCALLNKKNVPIVEDIFEDVSELTNEAPVHEERT